MSLVEELRGLKHDSQVAFHDFLIEMKRGKKTLHIFYEGKTDNGFYGSMLRREVNKEVFIKSYICGSKDEVYSARKRLLVREYIDNYLLFFVDKDLDDIVPVERTEFDDLYVTETYSIENILICSDVFSQACSELFKIDSGSEAIEHVKIKFIEAERSFCHWVVFIMAWVLCCRRLGLKPNLSNIKLSDICKVDGNMNFLSIMDSFRLIDYLKDKTNANGSILQGYIEEAIDELSKFPEKSYIRGKFHLWILIECINVSREAIENAYGKKIKMHININSQTVIDILGPRVRTPQSLIGFLRKNCAEIMYSET